MSWYQNPKRDMNAESAFARKDSLRDAVGMQKLPLQMWPVGQRNARGFEPTYEVGMRQVFAALSHVPPADAHPERMLSVL